MTKSISTKFPRLLGFFISFTFLCCLIACGNTENAGTDTGTGSNTTITDLSSLTLSIPSSLVTYGTSVTATAILRNAAGALVPNTVVTFTATSSLVAFTPVSATALTNSLGVASITLNAASTDSAGATSIVASAQLTSDGTTKTITSAPVGIAVNGAPITLGLVNLGTSPISSYGTSSVSVPVLVGGLPATVPISVTFTSPCVSEGKATLSSPVTTIAGTATSTYKDNNCNHGSDLITASVNSASAGATIIVNLPVVSNIEFVSATPRVIGTKTASAPGLLKNSVVKFRVVDSSNNGKAGVNVAFSLLPINYSLLGITFSPVPPDIATSDADGYVTATVSSGTAPTPVWVVATVVGSSPEIKSQSNTLTITTGLPTQNFFSLSASTHNIEGWVYDGVPTELMVIASDRLSNPVPDGTAINFIAEGGHTDTADTYAVCETKGGVCSVTFKSAEYKPIEETTTAHGGNGAVAAMDYRYDPQIPITITYPNGANSGPLYVENGRVTVLAYALGEESFVDSDGDNSYKVGDTFYDIGDLYLDSNENRTWDSNSLQPDLLEQYIVYNTGTHACETQPSGGSLPGNYLNVPSKENTCNETWGLNYVRRSQTIVFSGSTSQLSKYAFNLGGGSCGGTFYFWLMDENYNPMPAGTTVNTGSNAVYGTYTKPGSDPTTVMATLSVGGTPVIDTIHAGGTLVSLSIDGGLMCGEAGIIVNRYPHGTLNIITQTNTANVKTTGTTHSVLICNDGALDSNCQ